MKNILIILFCLFISPCLIAQTAFESKIKCGQNAEVLFSSDGCFLIVHDDLGIDGKGSVQILETIDGINYTEIDKLKGAAYGQGFGKSVSVSENMKRLLIGAPKANDIGKVFLYEMVDNKYKLIKEFIPSIPAQRFGSSVSISGDGNVVVIGAPNYSFKKEQGNCFVYDLSSKDSTMTPIILNPSETEMNFGQQVKSNQDGSIIAIGASTNDFKINCEGSISIFRREGVLYVPQGNRITLTKDYCSHFGKQIALSQDGLTIASGLSSKYFSALVWTYDDGKWTMLGKGIESFGGSRDHSSKIAMDSSGTIIAMSKALGKTNGEAMVFEYRSDEWTLVGNKIIDADENFKSMGFSFKWDVMMIKELGKRGVIGYRWD